MADKKIDEIISKLENINFLFGNYTKRIHEIEVILEIILEELKIRGDKEK